ncbi:MAG: DUF983 domain-containing protein [Acidimicrobiales bacterium]|nr:DUF983 domain-containing protein [Acidimicrobiales bacterium]
MIYNPELQDLGSNILDHHSEKGRIRLLWRGATKACPLCGRRKLFKKWFHMLDHCPRCGLCFERVEGHWIGAIGINTIVSLAILALGLAIFFFVTYPNIPTGIWVFWFAGSYGVVPILFYPYSKTLWTAIDILMRPLEQGEFHEDWELGHDKE